MENALKIPIRKVIFDVLLFVCVAFPLLILMVWGEPHSRGFFCNDESINYPYVPTTKLTKYFIIVTTGSVPFLILIFEILTCRKHEQKFLLMGYKLPMWIWKVYNVIGIFFFGIICNQLIGNIIKYSVGRLRPHFLTVCMPNINCNDSINFNIYHEDFVCTNAARSARHQIRDARLSFPSGHSTFSMFVMLYFAIYLQSRLTWRGSKLLKHTIQFFAIAASVYIGMTRISSYHHHWSDVLGGFLIGATTAVVVAKYAADLKPAEEGCRSKVQKNGINADEDLLKRVA